MGAHFWIFDLFKFFIVIKYSQNSISLIFLALLIMIAISNIRNITTFLKKIIDLTKKVSFLNQQVLTLIALISANILNLILNDSRDFHVYHEFSGACQSIISETKSDVLRKAHTNQKLIYLYCLNLTHLVKRACHAACYI